jgi:hypothetical protein
MRHVYQPLQACFLGVLYEQELVAIGWCINFIHAFGRLCRVIMHDLRCSFDTFYLQPLRLHHLATVHVTHLFLLSILPMSPILTASALPRSIFRNSAMRIYQHSAHVSQYQLTRPRLNISIQLILQPLISLRCKRQSKRVRRRICRFAPHQG